MIPQKVADTAYAGTGIAAITFPEWLAMISGGSSVFIQICGVLIVAFTLLKVITEWRIARRKLRDLERGE